MRSRINIRLSAHGAYPSPSRVRNPKRPAMIEDESHKLPDEIWELIISKLARNDDDNDDDHLEFLSLVSKQFLSITNRLKQTLSTSVDSAPDSYTVLFSRFPNLVRFSYHGCDSVPDPDGIILKGIILELSQFKFPLQVLDLSGHRTFPVGSIAHLPIATRTSVRSLILKNFHFLSNKDMGIMADLFPYLEELDISRPYIGPDCFIPENGTAMRLNDIGIALLASKEPRLRRINLQDNRLLSDKFVISLCENCPDLEEIVLTGCCSVTQIGVNKALGRCKHLRFIGLPYDNLVPRELTYAISNAKSLREIDLWWSLAVTDELLRGVSNANLPLRKISLSLPRLCNVTLAGIKQLLKSYRFLDHFALGYASFLSDEAMAELLEFLLEAKTVRLHYCKKLSSLTFFAIIKSCSALDTLEMEAASVGKENLYTGKACNIRIKVLNLTRNVDLCDHSLSRIVASCPNLEVLKTNFCPAISGRGIGYTLRDLCSLRHIQIKGCHALQLVADCHTKLEIIEMGGTNIDDQMLYSIVKRCPQLKYLEVLGCPRVTNEGLGQLMKMCAKLKYIYRGDIPSHFVDLVDLSVRFG